jgi:SAM-dependent methyltransferase
VRDEPTGLDAPRASPEPSSWERPETVAWFAARPPDARVVALFSARPRASRVLDLGCAAGRNADWLARAGFDVHALDASSAMVAHTRERLAARLGREEAAARVRRGDMADLGAFADGEFDAVIAIGVLPGAGSWLAWRRAVAEIARVLTPGGELILTHFTPDTGADGPPLERVAGEPHLYRRVCDDGPSFLLQRPELDAYLAAHGFDPLVETVEVPATTTDGQRTTLAGHFRKRVAAVPEKETR